MDEHKRRTEITIETHSVMRIKTVSGSGSFCGDCQEMVIPLLEWQAARVLGTNKEHVESLRLAGELHGIEEEGICSASLACFVKKENL